MAPWPTTEDDSSDNEPETTIFHTAANIRFYERNGFRADGTETVDPRLSDLRELRMVR